MSTLTVAQIRRLAALMDERFRREMDEIQAVTQRSRAERGWDGTAVPSADPLDAALAETALAADFAVVQQDVQDVRDILAARRRLAAGSYGECADCGEPIAFARLLAYPTAKRCIECQRAHEARHAMPLGGRVAMRPPMRG